MMFLSHAVHERQFDPPFRPITLETFILHLYSRMNPLYITKPAMFPSSPLSVPLPVKLQATAPNVRPRSWVAHVLNAEMALSQRQRSYRIRRDSDTTASKPTCYNA